MRVHGVLVEIAGCGVLLLGPSGVGKSECALELVARGQRLVADDAVELRRDDARLVCRAVPAIAGLIEIRGLGILSVSELYGADALAEEAPLDLVCRVEPVVEEPDRTGLDRGHEEWLGVSVPRVVLPSQPGASLATIVDAAARDALWRRVGPSAAERFAARTPRPVRQP